MHASLTGVCDVQILIEQSSIAAVGAEWAGASAEGLPGPAPAANSSSIAARNHALLTKRMQTEQSSPLFPAASSSGMCCVLLCLHNVPVLSTSFLCHAGFCAWAHAHHTIACTSPLSYSFPPLQPPPLPSPALLTSWFLSSRQDRGAVSSKMHMMRCVVRHMA